MNDTTAPNGGMHNLGTILKRLEAVTSRLEDAAIHGSLGSAGGAQTGRSPAMSTHESVGGAAAGGAAAASAPPPAASEEPAAPHVQAYQELISGPLKEFTSKSEALGGVVAQHAALLPPLLQAQLDFLSLASKHAKPATKDLPALLGPQGQAISAIVEAKDKLGRGKEGREWGACLSTVGEGVSAWGWVQVEPAPAPFIGEMKNASQFWADRVTKQFKETKPEAIAWAKSFTALIDALQAYVKQHHTTGVTWNPRGPPAPSSVPASSSAPAAAPSTAPSAPAAKSTPSGGPSGLLASLNQGGAVTSGLRKVDPSQMTHKNPELRTSSAVPAADEKKAAPVVKPKPAFGAAAAKKPAKTELEGGNRWSVEYHEDNRDIQITDTAISHVVHIFQCRNSTIRITGKVNAVTMVNCKKVALVLDSAVSALSITSSPSFEVQITGTVPTIQVDNTDGGQLYLSKEGMGGVEIITSKTSAINISTPEGEDGDLVERPVPEQMKTVVRGGKLVTEIVEHKG
ncbi:adenylyl cyclase-associated protein [Dioszegia hungarica]|uniref:Adenylyl cyclase-associated protein n=1 Tax=Dioszegia hungarica TaxID=4972 RepID=A0AA38GZX7_9TREE|nr:adenylyl cyclase-associated protein [Dioszegia hungarica]KAI9632103.1 adenylyl cyclase-associated protein [Dioszegia hungarica]